jgi:hypothetical protein
MKTNMIRDIYIEIQNRDNDSQDARNYNLRTQKYVENHNQEYD